MWYAIILLSIIVAIQTVLLWVFRKELKEKTFLFWEQEGDYKVLRNSKGDEITRI